jgi:hypothetical protein
MVKTAVATALCVYPAATAMALIVAVDETVIAEKYSLDPVVGPVADAVVGVVPSVVK